MPVSKVTARFIEPMLVQRVERLTVTFLVNFLNEIERNSLAKETATRNWNWILAATGAADSYLNRSAERRTKNRLVRMAGHPEGGVWIPSN